MSSLIGMLSPRLSGSESQQKPAASSRKAYDPKERRRDGFEIFYGLEPKSARGKRRTSTGSTVQQPPSSTSKVVAAAPSCQNSDNQEKAKPTVPRLQLGPSKEEAPSSAAHRSSARRATAPSSASSPSKEEGDGFFGFASAAVAAMSALAAEGVAAMDQAMTPRPRETDVLAAMPKTTPRTSQCDRSEHDRESGRSRRKSGADKIWTPRGVPVFSLNGQPQMIKPVPEDVEKYSMESPSHSPSRSSNSLPIPNAGTEPLSSIDEAAGGQLPPDSASRGSGFASSDEGHQGEAESGEKATQSRPTIPTLALQSVTEPARASAGRPVIPTLSLPAKA